MKNLLILALLLLFSLIVKSQDYCYSKISEEGKNKCQFESSLYYLELYIDEDVRTLEKVLPKYKVINVFKLAPNEYKIVYRFDNNYTLLKIQVLDSINGTIKMISLLDISPSQNTKFIEDALENKYQTKDKFLFTKENRTLLLYDNSEYRYCVTFY